MMKVGGYFRFKKGNVFKIISLKDGLYFCRVVNRYDKFYITQIDLEQKIFDDEIYEIKKPEKEVFVGMKIRK